MTYNINCPSLWREGPRSGGEGTQMSVANAFKHYLYVLLCVLRTPSPQGEGGIYE